VVPLLGVCLGHQGIAVAFGGTVGADEPAHGVLSPVSHDGTGLFAGLPQGFAAVRYHSLAVTEVPPDVVVTARSGDGMVMGLRHRDRPLSGGAVPSGVGARRTRRPADGQLPGGTAGGAVGGAAVGGAAVGPGARAGRPAAEVPFGFHGGWVGYLGYECKADTGGRLAHRAASPDACLLQVRRFLAFDHEQRQVYAVSLDADAPGRLAELAGLAGAARQAGPLPAPDPGWPGADPGWPGSGRVRATMSRRDHRRAFEVVQRELRAGNTYELNLTYQAGIDSAAEPFAVYRLLRRENPAPYAAFLTHPGVAVLSSSPERFLAVDADGVLEVRPIKGTTPRGRAPAEDAANSRRLAGDPRFRSENLMIVDLVRNDVGLVSAAGSVQVPSLMAVESYAAVHQLVSTVRGTLAPGASAVDAARALFPPGSMTGASKERTMAIIDAVERRARGVYSGALGWFGVDGRADLSVIIRTLVHHGEHYRLGTGGGITVYSDPASEYAETQWKSEPLIRAIASASAPAASRPVRPSRVDG
jgi:para-aminobenzoate synthetase